MSQRIDVKKNNDLREFIICHYWYFLETSFRFQPKLCDDCHDLIRKVTSFNYVTNASVKRK